MTEVPRERPNRYLSAPRTHQAQADAGYILVGVLVLLLSVVIFGLGFYAIAGHEVRSSEAHLDSERAFWLAEAGKEHAIQALEDLNRNRPPERDEQLFTNRPGPDGGSYSVRVYVDPNALFKAQKDFMLESVGTFDGMERRVLQKIRLESFAKYAYFTDDERSAGGGPIWFASADLLEGPVHSNGVFHINGSPRFMSEVTSAADHMIAAGPYTIRDPSDWPAGGNNPFFAEGFTLAVDYIPLPSETADLKAAALAGGLFLGPASDVELGRIGLGAGVDAPGWLRHKQSTKGPDDWIDVSIATLPSRVVYVNGDVNLSGILDGELTVASRTDIHIVDDLVYAGSDAAGTPQPGCDDLLGIVAESNIIFEDNTPNATDLKVNAVLMALDTSITAENYHLGPPRGTLTIWGGLIQKHRGAVGQIGAGGTIVHGYRKDYHYDPRVTGRPPPQFPLRGNYQEIAWEETWDAVPAF